MGNRSKKKEKLNSEQANKAKGRRDGSEASQNNNGRERNVGHKNAEEHSIKPKGGSSNWGRRKWALGFGLPSESGGNFF